MAAIQSGSAVVTNGSAIVKHVWTLVLTNVVGSFNPGELILWAGGAGTVLSYNTVLRHLKIIRNAPTTDSIPTPDLPVSAAGGASAVIAQNGPGTPGNWSTGTVGLVPIWFHIDGRGIAHQVQSLDETDQLTLTTAYSGVTEPNGVRYGITQDYTSNYSIPIVSLGDIDSPTVFSLAMQRIDLLFLDQSMGRGFSLPSEASLASLAVGDLYYDTATETVKRKP